MKLYLDDIREAPKGWHLVRSVYAAIELLKSGNVAEISLDHDLGEENSGTGYDILLWIERAVAEEGFNPPKIHIHSANSSARIKMELAIRKINQLLKDRIK